MARGKKSAPESEGSWLDTYADLVTLLLCFFVLLFSQSTIEDTKWAMLIEAFQNSTQVENPTQIVLTPSQDKEEGPGGNTGDALELDFSDLAQLIQETIENAGEEVSNNVEMATSANQGVVFLRFENDLLFDGNSSVLKPAALDLLNELGDTFVEYDEKIAMIRVNGHTAKVTSSGKYVSDRLLSSDRANAVVMYLEDVKKVDPTKLISIGYGGNYPIAPNDSEENRAKNRRVELLILSADHLTNGDDYLKQLFSGNTSLKEYDEIYGALNMLPSLPSGESSSDGLDYIDRIQLDDIVSGS